MPRVLAILLWLLSILGYRTEVILAPARGHLKTGMLHAIPDEILAYFARKFEGHDEVCSADNPAASFSSASFESETTLIPSRSTATSFGWGNRTAFGLTSPG